MHNFHDAYQTLPASRYSSPSNWCSTSFLDWAVAILPFLEQDALYQQWVYGQPYSNQAASVRGSAVKIYYCPSRRSPPQLSTSGDPGGPGALGDYAGCCGSFDAGPSGCCGYVDCSPSTPAANGVLIMGLGQFANGGTTLAGGRGQIALASITDGTSNTFLLGEKHVFPGNFGVANGDGSIYCDFNGRNFLRIAGPRYPLATSPSQPDPYGNPIDSRFGSYHPGVCQFVFCDGGVRAIPVSIDETTLGLLAARNDGQVIPDF
jgi:hypothetical protein